MATTTQQSQLQVQENTLQKDKPASPIRTDRAARLKYLRELTRLSRQKFAKEYTLPYGSLQNWEDPTYGGLTKSGAPRVIEALKKEGILVDMNWLLHGRGPAPYVSALALLKRMKIKRDETNNDETATNENVIIGEELGLFKHHYQSVINTTVQDNAMAPFFQAGDQVAGKKFASEQFDQLIGEVCIVIFNKKTMVRLLEKGSQANRFNLTSTNPNNKNIIENADITAAAKIGWMRRPLNQTQ